MILPTFIIGGAARSGTTFLARALAERPDVFVAELRPEPKFFLVDDEFERGLSYYSRRYFADAAEFFIRGEKSTNYLESARAADRIAEALPEVKLVFMLRDPADRAFSNYLWSVQNGLEDLSFADAIDAEETRERKVPDDQRFSRPFAYISRGMYAEHLSRYLERFQRQRVLIVIYEEFMADPALGVSRVLEFLGADLTDPVVPPAERVNASRNEAHSEIDPAFEAMLRSIFAEPNRRLEELLGREIPEWS